MHQNIVRCATVRIRLCILLGHVYGTASKRDQCYEGLRVTRNAWDTNLCKANSRFVSINLEAGGGGQFMVLPLENVGKIPSDYPVISGHSGAVLDTDFNPFNDCISLVSLRNHTLIL